MSLKTVEIALKYDSSSQNIVNEFYLPVLSECCSYDRISGFFTSSSLLISFRGLEGLIKNDGKIRLIVSPRLSSQDVEVLENYQTNMDNYLQKSFEDELEQVEDGIVDPKDLLGWLLANDKLEIKIAIIKKNGRICTEEEINESALFHQKIGILRDKYGNILSFSGSINETAKAWTENNEEFKTFKSWEEGQKSYITPDIEQFEKYWNGGMGNTLTYDFPIALKNKLINSQKIKFEYDSSEINRIFYKKENEDIPLFTYQKKAQKKWLDVGKKMIFEMATGTGKTRTALSCMKKNLDKNNNNFVVIATPEETLTRQWQKEIESLDIHIDQTIFASGTTKKKWVASIEENISLLNIGIIESVLVLTTHATASSKDFLDRISKIKNDRVNTLFIGDEVHALGSPQQRRALNEVFIDRIGLSATPSRWFDEAGSKLLSDYFGNEEFVFGIDKALSTVNPMTNKTFLCNYEYKIIKVSLTDDELQEYIELSDRISKKYLISKSKDEDVSDHTLEELRANIIKSAYNKLIELEKLIIEIGPNEIKNTIIFCSPELIGSVCDLLHRYNIIHSKFTKDQGKSVSSRYNDVSERQFIIEQFKQENIKVLVAIKCLDEGIDIPTADTAILLSSTTNPREYIQRIGRVIRQSDNKKRAYIYDFITTYSDDFGDVTKYVNKIENNERKRSLYIIENAINNAECLEELNELLEGGLG